MGTNTMPTTTVAIVTQGLKPFRKVIPYDPYIKMNTFFSSFVAIIVDVIHSQKSCVRLSTTGALFTIMRQYFLFSFLIILSTLLGHFVSMGIVVFSLLYIALFPMLFTIDFKISKIFFTIPHYQLVEETFRRLR